VCGGKWDWSSHSSKYDRCLGLPTCLINFCKSGLFLCHSVVVGVRPLAYRHEESECMNPVWVSPSQLLYVVYSRAKIQSGIDFLSRVLWIVFPFVQVPHSECFVPVSALPTPRKTRDWKNRRLKKTRKKNIVSWECNQNCFNSRGILKGEKFCLEMPVTRFFGCLLVTRSDWLMGITSLCRCDLITSRPRCGRGVHTIKKKKKNKNEWDSKCARNR
jgi:hypothetical protein